MRGTLKFRDATISDAPVLRHWDTLDHVIDSDPDDEWNWEEELARQVSWRVQWMFSVNEEPIGFVQIIDPESEESHYWGNIGPGYRAIDIWIGPQEFLGKGYGTQMMEAAIAHCFSNMQVEGVLIDPLVSNHRAIKFYKRLGFVFLEEREFEDSKCSVHILHRSDWNERGLK